MLEIKNYPLVYGVASVISFGSFVFGYSLVCITMMDKDIQEANHITEQSKLDLSLSMITTALPLGALIGTFAIKWLCDEFGQRKAMLYLDIFAFCTILLQCYSATFYLLIFSRLMLGIYVGACSGIIPAYLISISPPQISGIVGSFNQLFITIGIAFSYFIGSKAHKLDLSFDERWAFVMGIPAIFIFCRIILLSVFSFDTLERLYKNCDNKKILEYINMFYQQGTVQQLMSFKKIKKVGRQYSPITPKKVMVLALVISFANQLSGINAILFYAKQVFGTISNHNQELTNSYVLWLGILQVIVTFGSGFLINNFGRRSLMLIGEGVIVSSLMLGFFADSFLISENLLIFVVFCHVIGFSLSLGPIGMMYIAELVQDMSLYVIVVWILTLFVSMVSDLMIGSWGIGIVFLFYGIVSLICMVYLLQNMVESKDRSREEIHSKIVGQYSPTDIVEENQNIY